LEQVISFTINHYYEKRYSHDKFKAFIAIAGNVCHQPWHFDAKKKGQGLMVLPFIGTQVLIKMEKIYSQRGDTG